LKAEPSLRVLRAFGIAGTPAPLPGGQSGAFRAGTYVLKRSELAEEVAWAGEVLEQLTPSGLRVAPYKRTVSGQWSFEGWFAQKYVTGEHATDRWRDVLDACDAYHRALAGVSQPAFLAGRTNPWCVADRMSWNEEPLAYDPRLADFVRPLAALLRRVDLPSQVIHGDFSGNVLFADGLAPAVIDFTPYWRPASFARAVVVMDALTWHGADETLLDVVANDAQIEQMLVRAELRRLLEIDQQFRQFGRDSFSQLPAHRRVIALLAGRR
jgi:uncharacterized protein (TIGR02569 family)